jgi:arsenite methyltransferase
MNKEFTKAISLRYNELSGKSCCLSCGGAINYAHIQPGFICVDLGSGKGFDVLKMATLATDSGTAYGIDVSEAMLDTARQNAKKLNRENAHFIRSELEKLPLEDQSADLVLSNCTINHSLQQEIVWKEIWRILKPGGTFVISDIYALQPVPDNFRNDPQAVAECWAGAVTREQYFRNIADAGFDAVEIMEESLPYKKGEIEVCSFTIRGVKQL